MNPLAFFKKTPLASTWLYLALMLIIWGTGPALIDTCKSAGQPSLDTAFPSAQMERSFQWLQSPKQRSCPSCPACSDGGAGTEGCAPLQRQSQLKRQKDASQTARLSRSQLSYEPSLTSRAIPRHHAVPTFSNPALLRSVVLRT